MLDYRFTVVAGLSHPEPLAYSKAPRTVPTLVSRFVNPRPPVQNWTAPETSRRASAASAARSEAQKERR
jgi:hypothetical protein